MGLLGPGVLKGSVVVGGAALFSGVSRDPALFGNVKFHIVTFVSQVGKHLSM